MDKTVLMKV